ncbi:MAG: protein kinase, partial [Myxococcota bacterium]
MAEIFRAKTFGAAGFEKEFAIKLILPSLVDDKEFVDMFINEAKIAVSLYHANVVQVFDLGQLDEQYYIAMEFVHGKDLLDVLARCAELDIKIPLNLVLYISMEMLKGLDFAHRAKNPYGEDLNIIHRDVSPSNILISYLGDVKVGDFGVAKAAIQRNLTESGTLKGKVGYMSPEQVMGEKIDSRSDIFSAGIVFFEALSMSRLFVGGSDLDVMLRVRDADISESLEKAGPLPSDLRDIVNRALERHREERYQNAGQFYQALVDFCFRHNIKTTESDLSNFMRRLFAEEIEREKARRRNDPQASVMLDSRAQFPSVADSFTMSEPSSDTLETGEEVFDTLDQATPGVSTEQGLEGAASAAGILNKRPVKRPAEPARAEYRYQDANGLVYGPMTMMTLEGLLLSRPPTSSDRVSVDGAQWMGLEEVEELRRVLDEMEAERESGVSRSRPLSLGRGIAVQRSEAMAETVDHVPRGKSLGMGGLESLSSDGVSGPSLSDPPRVEMSGAHPKVVDELRGNYTSYEGSFRDISFARAMARLHRSKSTGRLTVKRDAIEKSIYMNNGEIIFVDSNKEDELLGEFLLSRGIITPKQLQEGLARLSEWGGRLGDALVATGAIPAHDIFQHLS